MHPVILSASPVPIPAPLPGVPPSSTMIRSEPAAEHDATVLVAALEDIESRRQTIEWLLEAGLLGQCLG